MKSVIKIIGIIMIIAIAGIIMISCGEKECSHCNGSGNACGAFGTVVNACSNCQTRGDNSCWVCYGTGKVSKW